MAGRIYLLNDDAELVSMVEKPYDSEHLLQTLLASHPDLLAGEQIEPKAPRRWLLVKREMGIPSEEDGGGRWSVDHVFLDQDAIPTLIEVKRSSDTRIRREVVGQMLDYAANAVMYWPVEEMQTQFERDCEVRGVDPTEELASFLAGASNSDEFWQRAKTNLQAGKIRMLFVADVIPPELRRIVEFLNEQLDPAEMLAVEVKQYSGQGMRTLVPRVIGQTAEAEKRKSTGRREMRQWDEDSFFGQLATERGQTDVAIARKLLEWAQTNNVRVWWGQGKTMGSFIVIYDDHNGKHHLFGVWSSNGRVEVQFQHLLWKPPFESDEQRLEVINRFRSIDGIDFPDDAVNRRPSVLLSDLANETKLNQFLGSFDWILGKIKSG
ncbi:hypothetical protein Pan258_29810 [Symmachiella dynata]|uniref:hypothetical protein n=1 Tax=Symmachiella dynata TaxID=2527995 RepID=UPI00118B58FE|nr:hypothetical protein [Symmachiella dynata]QDT48934.1 hypothetical protein Pan258_29810 [Symmachiella dynata]